MEDEEVEFVIDKIIDDFNETIKKLFLDSLTFAKEESTLFVAPNDLDCFSLAITSYIFDLTIFNHSFMRMPSWLYHTSIVMPIHVGIDDKDNVGASKLLDRFRQCRYEKDILVIKEDNFAEIICNALFSYNKEMISDYSLAYIKLPYLFVNIKNIFSEIIEKFSDSRRMLNLYMVEGLSCYSKIAQMSYELYDELKDNCANKEDDELQQLTHDCIENFCDQLIKNSKTMFVDLIESLNELLNKMYQQAEENHVLFNKIPIEAGTTYGEWLYCFAKLNAFFNVDLLSEEEKDRQTKIIMKEVFKDNPIIASMVNEVIDRNDPDLDMVDSTFIYYKYLWDNKKDELDIDVRQCAIIAMLLCCGTIIHIKDGTNDPNLFKFFLLISTIVIEDDGGNKYDFGDFIQENDMFSHLSFIYRAAISSVIASTYFTEGNMKLDEIHSRRREFYEHIDDLLNERAHIDREESSFAKMNDEYDSFFKDLIEGYKQIADEFISMIDESLKEKITK